MILSVSRRSDVPAFYGAWFQHRLEEGFVCYRNPFNYNNVYRVQLNPQSIEGIVFWTKYAEPFRQYLDSCEAYPYYFQYSITAYDQDIEPGLPEKARVVDDFIALAQKIGATRMIWRYDPILLNDRYTMDIHRERFAYLCSRLAGHARHCVISFVDLYEGAKRGLGYRVPTDSEVFTLAEILSTVAKAYGIKLVSCAEAYDLSAFGIQHGSCVDTGIFSEITGKLYACKQDRNQRPDCRCVASVDIGAYDSCPHGCTYCYANHGASKVAAACGKHDPASPLLVGSLLPSDRVMLRNGIN